MEVADASDAAYHMDTPPAAESAEDANQKTWTESVRPASNLGFYRSIGFAGGRRQVICCTAGCTGCICMESTRLSLFSSGCVLAIGRLTMVGCGTD